MAFVLEHDVEERLAGDAGHGGLSRRVNVHECDAVGLIEGSAELVVQHLREQGRTGVAMRLEEHMDVLIAKPRSGGDGGGDFSGVMRVVVDDGDAAHFTDQVEATADAGEARKRLGDLGRVEAERPQQRDDARGVQDVMTAGILLDGALDLRAIGHDRRVAAADAVGLVGGDAHVAALVEAVGVHASALGAGDVDHVGIFAARHDDAVCGDQTHEVVELVVDLVKVLIVVEVIGLDVGDEHRLGRQVREGLVGFVGLDHVMGAGAGVGVGAVGAHDAADEEGGVGAQRVERAGEHGRRGGLAVRARHGERIEAHAEMREHLGAMPDLKTATSCLDELGVVLEDGRGDDDDRIALGDVLRLLADEHGDAGLAQLLGVTAFLDIGARHLHALVVGHAGDAAHAHAADADEVHLLDALFAHVACLLKPMRRSLRCLRRDDVEPGRTRETGGAKAARDCSNSIILPYCAVLDSHALRTTSASSPAASRVFAAAAASDMR